MNCQFLKQAVPLDWIFCVRFELFHKIIPAPRKLAPLVYIFYFFGLVKPGDFFKLEIRVLSFPDLVQGGEDDGVQRVGRVNERMPPSQICLGETAVYVDVTPVR